MIDPEKIRRQLEDVWVTLGAKGAPDGGGVLRACSLTLIAVAEENGEQSALAQTIAEVMPEHPARAIVVRLAAGDGDLLEADVEAQCWMPFGGRQQICSEQIVIRCTDRTLSDVPGVLAPLVVADLPVVLWCASWRVRESASFAGLAESAGRVVFDTARAPQPVKAIAALGALQQGKARIADLGWTRLTRWRALMAQVFENERYRRQLLRPERIRVAYEQDAGGPVPAAAIWMAAWAASRLGWNPESLGERLLLQRQEVRCLAGRLAGVELSSERAVVRIERNAPSSGEVRVELQGFEPVMNRVALPLSTDALALGEELGITTADAVFEQTLPVAAGIAARLIAA